MGINKAFDQNTADFSEIFTVERKLPVQFLEHDRVFYMNKFVHKVCLETSDQVDENAIKIFEYSEKQTEYVNFHCDRPFLFLIHDKIFENIIFIGKYVKPIS